MPAGRHRRTIRRLERVKLRRFYDGLGRFHQRCICPPYGDNERFAHFPLCPKSILPKS